MLPASGGTGKSNTPTLVPDSLVAFGNPAGQDDCLPLAALLMAPGSPARALWPDGNNGGAHLGDGDVLELIKAHPDAAILGRVRPDLLAIDMDGTADLLDDVEDAAAAVGAVRVYLALSGSVHSLHAVYAPPTASARRGLAAVVERLSMTVEGELDPRSPDEWLRLPGSPSLKAGGGSVTPVKRVDDVLVPLTPGEALETAQAALEARERDRAELGVPFDVAEFAPAAEEVLVDAPADVPRESSGRFDFHACPDLDAEARDALAVSCPRGADATLHALRAAWHLWRCGYRDWEDVAGIVMSVPALARWRRQGRADARRRWAMECRKWAALRPELGEDEARLVAEARAAGTVLPAHLEAVLDAVLRRMEQVRRTDAVPVAVRDLVVWGACGSFGAAHAALEDLEAGSVLVRARYWEDGPAEEATLWTLQPASLWQVGGLEVDSARIPIMKYTPPLGVDLSHPVWLEVGHTPRRVFEAVLSSPDSSTAALASLVGLGSSTARRYLSRLEEVGMVSRSSRGRSVTWSGSLEGWGELPVVVAAMEALTERVRKVTSERMAWRNGLAKARSSRSTPDSEPVPGMSWQGDLFDLEPAGELPGLMGERRPADLAAVGGLGLLLAAPPPT